MPKTRKMLSDWNAPYIQSLLKLIETQSKETLANWAIDYSGKVQKIRFKEESHRYALSTIGYWSLS